MDSELSTDVNFLRQKLAEASVIEKIAGPKLLVSEASRWLGLTESGGENRGQVVSIFQRFAGIEAGFPWCMAFVQYCVSMVDRDLAILIGGRDSEKSRMALGANCMGVWNGSPEEIRSQLPAPGAVVIWHKVGSGQGHAGIVTNVLQTGNFQTIEGNSAPAGLSREGDGIFAHEQLRTPMSKDLELIGFIYPWGMTS